MTKETRQGRFVDYQRLARLVSQEAKSFALSLTSKTSKYAQRKVTYAAENDNLNAVIYKLS